MSGRLHQAAGKLEDSRTRLVALALCIADARRQCNEVPAVVWADLLAAQDKHKQLAADLDALIAGEGALHAV